jgi:hypothetical protein
VGAVGRRLGYSPRVVAPPPTPASVRALAPCGPDDVPPPVGRDADRNELVRLLTGEDARAVLLYGEAGVGKTSLIDALLVPRLREREVQVLVCDDPRRPAEALAAAMTATGARAQAGEAASAFLARTVAAANPGELFVFVLDDVDRALAAGDEHVAQELAELYTRVVGRAAGRARFLYVCSSEHVHLLAHLERRTGSLFHPGARHELHRLRAEDAAAFAAASLAGGGRGDPALAEALVRELAHPGVLPLELRLALLAVRELRLGSTAGLHRAGGAGELERLWLAALARRGGDESAGLRVLAELTGGAPVTAAAIAKRLTVPVDAVERSLAAFTDGGAAAGVDGGWALPHPAMGARVRELTAPARAAARRAHELLGARAATGERLRLRELWTVHSEGITPGGADERTVLTRSYRFYRLVAGAAIAVPIALLVLLWALQRGHGYLDLRHRPGGDRVVLRAGRAGLSAFDWMPSSPGFGDVVADTGLTRAMVAPTAWRAIAAGDVGGALGGWERELDRVTEPRLAGLIAYAAGDDAALARLRALATDPESEVELYGALRPIARGTTAEVAMIEQALATAPPAVQQAAVTVAGSAAARHPDAYQATLVRALTASDSELRRSAFATVRDLSRAQAQAIYAAALERDPDATIRRELQLELAGEVPPPSALTPEGAVELLLDPDVNPAARERARANLRRAFGLDRANGRKLAARLIADERAATDARVFAIELVMTEGNLPAAGDPALVPAVQAAIGSHTDAVRAAALPLYARVAPAAARAELERLGGDRQSRALRVGIALGWGALARTSPDDARAALDRLLKDESVEVRAAAAEGYGYLGRAAQETLLRLIKIERLEIGAGAARGMMHTADVGASVPVAVGGIGQLWKRQGKPRREAAAVFAAMARTRPGPIMTYLVAASRNPDDDELHPIGTVGLCHAANQGNPEARRQLMKVTADPSPEVRRLVIRCVADAPDAAKNGLAVATRLMKDPDPQIRADAARVITLSATRGGKVQGGVADALVGLLDDSDREVRLIATHAIGSLGGDAPGAAAPAMVRAFGRADEAEKLALLRAGQVIGADDLIAVAITDGSPLVRVQAVDTALATGVRAATTVSAGLADADPEVRRAVLDRLDAAKDKLEPAALDRALALAVRDPNPELRQLALTTVARVAPKDAVAARLGRALSSRAERERAQAAAAAIGLVERDAPLAVKLLTPLLADPSHDVRVAMLASLGAAYATINSPEQLAHLLTSAERDAMARLAAAAGFLMLAGTDAGRDAASRALGRIAQRGPVMARRTARLALGLIDRRADGIAFLEQLVP